MSFPDFPLPTYKAFLLVNIEPDFKAAFMLSEVPTPAGLRDDPQLLYGEVNKFRDAWQRFPKKDRRSLGIVLGRIFPHAVEIAMPNGEAEINALCDQGEVHEAYMRAWGQNMEKMALSVDSHWRSIDGEWVNRQGIPIREINCITGEPYPKPPEGMRRFVVSVNYGFASYMDAHRMWMAPNHKQAALDAVAYLKSDENPTNGGGLAGIFGAKDAEIHQIIVRDFDDEGSTQFFHGEEAKTRVGDGMLGMLFSALGREEEEMDGDGPVGGMMAALGGLLRGMK